MAKRKSNRSDIVPSLHSRSIALVDDGLLRIDQEYRVQGTEQGLDCIGRYWIFGVCKKTKGEIKYIRGSTEVPVPWETFGIFLPPFSLTEARLIGAHTINIGFLSSRPLPLEAPNFAVAFEIRKEANYESLIDILKSITKMHDPIPIGRGHDVSAIAEKIKRGLDSSYRESIRLSMIAEKLKLNPALMSRYFKSAYGITPVHYRNWLRTTEAMARLADGASIIETANDLGYGDLSQFYDQFGAITSASPGQYKKHKSKKPKT